jgi:hypothetical protein
VQNHIEQCDIQGSDAGGVRELCLLGCGAVLLGEYFPMFHRNLPSASGCSQE